MSPAVARARPARRWRVVAPAFAAGVGAALSLPPWGLWILAFPSAALLWWRLDRLPPGRRLLAGWAFGLGLYVVGLWWVTSFNVYGGVLLMALEALAPALAAALVPSGRGRTPALAGAMVLVEALRSSWPFGGLPLGGVALGQAGGPLADAARLGGPLLLVGLVWLGGGALGSVSTVVLRRVARRGAAGHSALVPVAGAVVAAALSLTAVVGVAVAGRYAADGGGDVGRVRVAAVQGGGVRGLRKAQVDPTTVFAAQVAATNALLSRPGIARPTLLVWPEDVIALNVSLVGSDAQSTVAALAVRARATLLAGVTEPAGRGHFRNEIVAFGPDGRIVARFDKVHRVPFGEYVPLRPLVRHLADLSAVPEDAVAGHGDGVLHTPAGPLGTMVSYEVFFAARGRVATRAGATLLVVPTNTSSYSTSQVPTQEIAAARLQAIEEGRDLVQAAPTGFSALIDHDGRVLARSSLGRRSLVVGELSLRTGRTLYERVGDLPVLVAALAGLLGGAVLAVTDPDTVRPTRRRR
ncbi:MAG: apolipoprotein N-acyltransferase [Acidimicrobiales bacterium]